MIKFHIWTSWNYEKVENWLEEMALKGYKLIEISGAGVIFHFEKNNPEKLRYCMEYKLNMKKEYEQLLIDDNWDIKYAGPGWFALSKKYENKRPELYSNYDLIISRMKNMKLFLIASIIFFAFSIILEFKFYSSSIFFKIILSVYLI
ncbi:DUF2812 domain-containing protein, partial [Clostridiaceae bacterium HSG29]|nr:DUF2812 domain-containing protein [Clostridiaceae bacterium HSG29]